MSALITLVVLVISDPPNDSLFPQASPKNNSPILIESWVRCVADQCNKMLHLSALVALASLIGCSVWMGERSL
jgi:hypothetical protein